MVDWIFTTSVSRVFKQYVFIVVEFRSMSVNAVERLRNNILYVCIRTIITVVLHLNRVESRLARIIMPKV